MRRADSPGFRLATAAVLAAAVVVVFWPVFDAGFVNIDDQHYVERNRHIKQGFTAEALRWAWTAGHSANWHPLTWMSHMLDWKLFGPAAGGHHAVNVALHAGNAVLLFLLLEAMTGARWRSAAVAALFAVHPLHVESVAWISERKDVLSTFLGFATLAAYARYARRPSAARMAAVAILYAAGLCAKPMLVTLPFVMLLLDRWPLDRPPGVREKLPLFALAGASSIATYLVQDAARATLLMESIGFPYRAGNAAIAYAAYLRDTVWPSGLAVFYPHPGKNLAWWAVALAAGLLAAITAAAWRARARAPYLLVGWLIYLGTLVPVIGLIQVGGQARADRYTYLPLVGIFVAIVWGAHAIVAAGRGRDEDSAAGIAPLLAILPVLAIASHAQATTWTDSITLWSHALEAAGANAGAHVNLANALSDAGRSEDAERHYREAFRLRPTDADAANGLGVLELARDRAEVSIPMFRQAVATRPNFPDAWSNLAVALSKVGRTEEALEPARRAVALDPDLAVARTNLGTLLLNLGTPAEAVPELREACRLDPESPKAHNNLGLALLSSGRPAEAVPVLERAVGLAPEDPKPLANLGAALHRSGRPGEAIPRLEAATAKDPSFYEAQNQLGMALVDVDRIDDAITRYEAALATKPDFVEALNNLGGALLLRGRLADGAQRILRAIELKPDYAKAHANLATAFYLGGRPAEAWREIEQARRLGFEPPAALVAGVRAKLPQR